MEGVYILTTPSSTLLPAFWYTHPHCLVYPSHALWYTLLMPSDIPTRVVSPPALWYTHPLIYLYPCPLVYPSPVHTPPPDILMYFMLMATILMHKMCP